MEWKHGKCWKSPILEGKLRVFISYLSKMRIASMFYNSSLFSHFLQLVSTIFCSRDIQIQVWQGFCQKFCVHFQIQMIRTAMVYSLSYKTRSDLNIKKFELESIFVEIINPKKSNIIVGTIYRHPKMDVTEYNNILNNIFRKKLIKNKRQCFF